MEGKLYLVGARLRLYKEAVRLMEQGENDLVTRFILSNFFPLNNEYLNKKWRRNHTW